MLRGKTSVLKESDLLWLDRSLLNFTDEIKSTGVNFLL